MVVLAFKSRPPAPIVRSASLATEIDAGRVILGVMGGLALWLSLVLLSAGWDWMQGAMHMVAVASARAGS